LTDPVRRAEAGEEVILTRHNHAVVRLTPIRASRTGHLGRRCSRRFGRRRPRSDSRA